jgi:hypothetical protein
MMTELVTKKNQFARIGNRMKPDYSLCTFVTSIAILLLQLKQLSRAPMSSELAALDGVSPSIHDEAGAVVHSRTVRKVTAGEYGPIYADLDIPHPSYVHVAGPGEAQVPLDILAELDKLRVAANTQRTVLTRANRMPPETQVSRMIAERTRAYMAEDARAVTQVGAEPSPPEVRPSCKPTSPGLGAMTNTRKPDVNFRSLYDLWAHVASTYDNRVGVILGVGKGDHVKNLLSHWKATYLYLVDPYIHLWKGYDSPENHDDKTHQLIFENLRVQLHTLFEGKFMFIRDFAHEFAVTYKKAAGQPAPGFVFLDANPSYTSVMKDLEAWYPLVQPGGLVAGSLFRDEGSSIGVKRAVSEFSERNGIVVWTFQDIGSGDTIWGMVKK